MQWYNGIRPEDTCPECNRADADNVTDNKRSRCILSAVWARMSPPVAVGFEIGYVAVHDSIPKPEPDDLARVQRQVQRSLDVTIGALLLGKTPR